MDLDFIEIDRQSETSIAEQLSNQLFVAVLNGQIKSNQKLPPEREFAEQLGVSRGTVKRAYSKLVEAKMLEIRQGSGSYILKNQQIFEENQKIEATKMIKTVFLKLNSIGLSSHEIINLMNLYYLSSTNSNRIEKINIMVVSNNHDILSELEQQLSYLTESSTFMFTLSLLTIDIITGSKDPIQMLLNYNLIIATSIDFPAIIEIAPMFREKILEVNLSPRTHTLIEFSHITKSSKIKIIYRTDIFRQMVIDSLTSSGISSNKIICTSDKDYLPIEHDFDGTDVLINFNESPVYINPDFREYNQSFLAKGGKIIRFEYQIKRNSLVQIEDRIQQILK